MGTIATGSATVSGIAECYSFTAFSVIGTSTISSDGQDIKLSNNQFVGYFEIGSSDGSEFKLDNFVFLKQSSTYDGDMTIRGYRDGTQVQGAETTVTVGGFSNQTADLSSNTAFENIDKIRLTFSSASANGIFLFREITIADPIDCNLSDTEDPVVTCPPSPAIAPATVSVVQFGGSPGDITYTITNSNGDIIGNGASVFGSTGSEFQLPCGADYNFNITNFVNCNCTIQGLNLSVNGATVLALGTGNPPIVEQSYPFTVDPCDITIPNGECTVDLTNLNPIGTPTDNCDTDPEVSWALTGATTGSGSGYFNQNGPQPFNAGTTTLTYTVEDNNGNTGTCNTVIVVDGSAGPDASFSYSAASYCANDADPIPTVTGEQGGVFSSTAGLSLNASTGRIGISESAPGTYTVTYKVTGTNCDGTSNVEVTINPADDPGFSYSPDTFCANENDPTPVITGNSGGSFSSTTGLTINSSTGEIDVSATTPGLYTVTYTTAGTCPNSTTDQVEVFEVPTLNFTPPGDFCIDAGVQTGLSGGSPSGGVYSGPGVSDDGNGQTYSFDPSTAGVGVHTLSYTVNSQVLEDDVEVFDLPAVTFTDPSAVCLNEEAQNSLSGGSPMGGEYSGPGVTDNNNGSSFTFDPSVAGVGMHTITYAFTDGNGCTNSAEDQITVFALPNVDFADPGDFCVDAGVQSGLNGGTPSGGVYSGTGVSDDGNGQTFSFDPGQAGTGMHELTYTYIDGNGCSNSQSVTVEVNSTLNVTLTDPDDVCTNEGIQTSLGGGLPVGGVYSGPGVEDDGNGETYSFDPVAAGVGQHTITYEVTSNDGCEGSDMVTIEVFASPKAALENPGDFCLNDGIQTNLSGGTEAGGVYTGPGVTDNNGTFDFDPQTAGAGQHTLTYTITTADGCSDEASQVFEVYALPTVTLEDFDSRCPNDGLATLGGGLPQGGTYSGDGVSDNNNGTNFEFDPQSAGVGVHTITYTYTSSDGCTVEATASLEVADTGTPEFTLCPGQQEVDMEDGLCYGLVPDLTAIVAATDDCGTPELTQNIQAGTSFGSAHLEEQTVTVTATDGAGKKATCEITLQLMDDQPPVPHCKSGTVNLNAEGTYELTLADLYDASQSSDNCGAVEVTDYEVYSLDCDDANTTLQLDVMVEDDAGNPASCQATLMVSDDADLPEQWQSTDMGSANTTGTYSFAPCSSNVPGGGDITISSSSNGNTNLNGDNIAFASQTLCGDIVGIQAKITVNSGSGYAGIMMRETLDSDSKQVALFTNNSALVRREVRYNTGAAKDISLISAPYSFYLRLRKQGNLVRQFVSTSGNNFSPVGAVSIDLGQCPEVGLALFSNDNTPVDATFSELQIRGEAPQSSPGLPLLKPGNDLPGTPVVYPNPAREQFTLELDQPLSDMAEVSALNQFGQLVAKWQMGPGEVLSDCSTSHWAAGVYYLHIHTPNRNFAPVKIIKTR
ncbi:MAG: T9SS type A sorting domain-containing protein [bacterium]|nr:T9SS type A sorting domain-containing protein [bacterium]